MTPFNMKDLRVSTLLFIVLTIALYRSMNYAFTSRDDSVRRNLKQLKISNVETSAHEVEIIESIQSLDRKDLVKPGCVVLKTDPDENDDDDQFEYEEIDRRRRRRIRKLAGNRSNCSSNVNSIQKTNILDSKDYDKNMELSNENIATVSMEEIQKNIHVHIRTKSRRNDPGCGGCMILWEMNDEIKSMGITVSNQGYQMDLHKDERERCPQDGFFSEAIAQNKTIIILYPEVDAKPCEGPGRRVHIHWLLAPLGTVARENIYETWNENDLVFSYSSACASIPNLPSSNVLQLLRSPEGGDETDIPSDVFLKPRKNSLMWMLRKSMPYKDHIKLIHLNIKNVTRIVQNESPHTDTFSRFKYFFSYDQFSFFSFIAAMMGTISIVDPLEDIPKSKWALGTYVGEYLRSIGGNDTIPGVAYGIDEEEIDHANHTMSEVREFLFKVKKWGRSTIPRFLRDGYRYGSLGERTNFEGAMFVRDAFSKDAMRKNWVIEYMETHEHTGYGKTAHRDNSQHKRYLDSVRNGDTMTSIEKFHLMQKGWLAQKNGFPQEMVDEFE